MSDDETKMLARSLLTFVMSKTVSCNRVFEGGASTPSFNPDSTSRDLHLFWAAEGMSRRPDV